MSVLPVLAIGSLWLTNRLDPGTLPRQAEKGERGVSHASMHASRFDGQTRHVDAIVELLDDGQTDVPDFERYGRDAKGRWWAVTAWIPVRLVFINVRSCRTRKVKTEDGYDELEKYCSVCNVWRPRRGYHCDKCGFCMVRFVCGFAANWFLPGTLSTLLALLLVRSEGTTTATSWGTAWLA